MCIIIWIVCVPVWDRQLSAAVCHLFLCFSDKGENAGFLRVLQFLLTLQHRLSKQNEPNYTYLEMSQSLYDNPETDSQHFQGFFSPAFCPVQAGRGLKSPLHKQVKKQTNIYLINFFNVDPAARQMSAWPLPGIHLHRFTAQMSAKCF